MNDSIRHPDLHREPRAPYGDAAALAQIGCAACALKLADAVQQTVDARIDCANANRNTLPGKHKLEVVNSNRKGDSK